MKYVYELMNKKGCLNTSLFIRTGYFVLDEMTDEVVDLAVRSPVPDHCSKLNFHLPVPLTVSVYLKIDKI